MDPKQSRLKMLLRHIGAGNHTKERTRRSWAPDSQSADFYVKLGAEKTQVLNEVQHLELRIERMMSAVHQTRSRLPDCLRTRSKEESVEKRRKKVEEHQLVSALLTSAKDLEGCSDTTLLRDVMCLYGNGLNAILDELVQCDIDQEKRVLERLNKFTEEEKNINHLKEKLKRATLDMDSAKRRLALAQQAPGGDKGDQVQEELDATSARVESCKDALITDMYTLAGKEVEMANIFAVLVETQMEYFKTAAKTLEGLQPQITKKIATYPRRPVFGCPLEDHLRYSGREVAIVLEVCCCALAELGLNDEGLFRISGNMGKVRKLKAALDAGDVDLTDYDKDPHSIAGTLKSYLRELPDPLLTHNLYNQWTQAGKLEGAAKLEAVKDCLSLLPKFNFTNLHYLVKFLAKVAEREKWTKMSTANLAIVMGPNLIWCPTDGDSFLGSRILECLLSNVDYFFPGEIRFNSSLIGTLHDRSGGFVELNGPLTSSDISEPRPRSPPEPLQNPDKKPVPTMFRFPKSEHQPSPPPEMPPVSPNPVSSKTATAAPAWQKRPKAPAPPPPRATLFRPADLQTPAAPTERLYPELSPSPTAPLSKSSSLDDSLNEYGSEPEFLEDPMPANEEPRFWRAKSSSPQEAAFSTVPASVVPVEDHSKTAPPRTHRKTNSLDRPVKQPPRPPIPTTHGSLDRQQKAALLTQSLTETELEAALMEESRVHPARPPLPSREVLERNSLLRSSTGGELEGSRPEAAPRRVSTLMIDASKDKTLNIAVNGKAPDSPPKAKPPLPAKPKNIDAEVTMTKL